MLGRMYFSVAYFFFFRDLLSIGLATFHVNSSFGRLGLIILWQYICTHVFTLSGSCSISSKSSISLCTSSLSQSVFPSRSWIADTISATSVCQKGSRMVLIIAIILGDYRDRVCSTCFLIATSWSTVASDIIGSRASMSPWDRALFLIRRSTSGVWLLGLSIDSHILPWVIYGVSPSSIPRNISHISVLFGIFPMRFSVSISASWDAFFTISVSSTSIRCR